MMDAVTLTQELVKFESTSRLSNVPVSDYVELVLRRYGFETERLEYDDAWGVRKASIVGKKGSGTGGIAYFGHTDVVPANPWKFAEHGPFAPVVKDGKLFGRGTCDMKGSVASMITAAGQVAADRLKSPIYITCTADEEVGYHGAIDVAKRSALFQEMVRGSSRGIIGEPTGLQVVHAHKGTFGFSATSHGRAAHSSTNKGLNANLAMIPFLVEMKAIHDELEADPKWHDARFDPPGMSWNIGINDHTAACNITAPQSICTVYFRPTPGKDAESLIERARVAAEKQGLEFKVQCRGLPVYVEPQSAFVQEVLSLAGQSQARTVAYGTDGTQFTALKQMVVLGPGDIAQAHTHDEFITLEQLALGTQLYGRLIEQWCC